MSESSANEGLTITLDGEVVEAKAGELVIAAAQRAGTYIPRFCYHERMRPVGMCRMCLVHVDTGRGPQLAPSCMLTVTEGIVVDTQHPEVERTQEGVLEHLLINHPLDCPVCDKGGECPLQDQTIAFGPGESRFIEQKRHFAKPIPVSGLVDLDRERCILCDRCTRFADEVAGDPLISFTERGNETQIQTFPGEPFASYFSGNTVQICPVGALTASSYRFAARPWDLTEATSTCTVCAVGCRISVNASRDQVLRHQGVDIESVNHGWLCDKGRFAFDVAASAERVVTPLLRRNDALAPCSHGEAVAAVVAAVERAGQIAVLGGARGTNEDAYGWAKLAAGPLAGALGPAHVDAQLGDSVSAGLLAGLPQATIADACAADVVLLVGADLVEELPVLHLRLRGAARDGATTLVTVGAIQPRLSDCAAVSVPCLGGEEAHALTAWLEGDDELARGLAERDVVVVFGRAGAAQSARALADIASVIGARLPAARYLLAVRRGNERGAVAMGLSPAAHGGADANEVLRRCAGGEIDLLFLVGCDPLADAPDRYLASLALSTVPTVVSVDGFVTESTAAANVVFPAALFGEKAGTTTNLEGRVSAVAQVVTAPGEARPDWMLAAELAHACAGESWGWTSVADVTAEVAANVSGYGALAQCSTADLTGEGVLAETARVALDLGDVSERPVTDGYGLRLVTRKKLYGNSTTTARSAALVGLTEPERLQVHPADAASLGVVDDEMVRVFNDRAGVEVPVTIAPAVSRGNAVMGGAIGHNLIEAQAPATNVRIAKLRQQ